MIWWTGLAPWEFEFPFPGSLTSTFLVRFVLTFLVLTQGLGQIAVVTLVLTFFVLTFGIFGDSLLRTAAHF